MRKNKQDWLQAGLKVLGEAGVMGLTIDTLTTELEVTKGSFYHHFRNVQDFQEQLIAFWAEQYLSTSPAAPDDPRELLTLLDVIMIDSFASITGPEIAIRVWAQEDDKVGALVQQVDTVRQQFVLKVFRAVTGDDRRAQLMSDMLSTILIGSMMVVPRMPPGRVLELYEEFKRLYEL